MNRHISCINGIITVHCQGCQVYPRKYAKYVFADLLSLFVNQKRYKNKYIDLQLYISLRSKQCLQKLYLNINLNNVNNTNRHGTEDFNVVQIETDKIIWFKMI